MQWLQHLVAGNAGVTFVFPLEVASCNSQKKRTGFSFKERGEKHIGGREGGRGGGRKGGMEEGREISRKHVTRWLAVLRMVCGREAAHGL